MSREFPELDQVRLVVDEAVKERHLVVIAGEVRAGRTPRLKRFRLLAVATTLLLLVPVIAFAADDAVPGDALYPVKRLFEPVVGLFDHDVEADHRVEEVEILHEREVEVDLIWQQIDRARHAVADPDSDHAERLRIVVDELEGSGDGDLSARDSDRGETREETGRSTMDEPSDSTAGRDEEVRRSQETTTTQESDPTTASSDRGRDG